jgi:P-type Ca2+ transporter type 2C
MANWHQQTADEIVKQLQSNLISGLDTTQAAERLQKIGPNEIAEGNVRSPWRILWEQFTAVLVLILIGAALLSALLGEFKDAIAIGAIVILFGLLGFVQEYRAERAMAALRKMATPLVRAIRGGKLVEISSREIVPGDVVMLEAGNLVPADTRLVEAINLRIQEAALTGESEPVEKGIASLPQAEVPLGDRVNMAYMGTVVTYGRGKALIVETGMHSELGKVASLLQGVSSEQTPLQKRLDGLGKLLAVVGFCVSALIFALGLFIGEPVRDMLLTAVSVAVAVVPEGLPAVVTITLAIGAQRMLRRNALIRKLPAVETLGSVTVICSDKTGTLTENRMTVMVLDIAGHTVRFDEDLRHHLPVLIDRPIPQGPGRGAEAQAPAETIGMLLAAGALCNDATLVTATEGGRIQAIGDPTEAALLIAALRFAGGELEAFKGSLPEAMPRVAELPFDSERKRMTTVHDFDRARLGALAPSFASPHLAGKYIAFTKGAVDGLLEIASAVWLGEHSQPLTESWHARVQGANDDLARQGMRVLGVGFRTYNGDGLGPPPPQADLERDLVLIGLVGLIDPPRGEVKDAVHTCRAAGIRPVMITGDHPLTAREIARQLGILGAAGNGHDRVITGVELSQMNDSELQDVVAEASVFARVSPEHKLRIVQALQNRGEIVAMTGDGVNDAPALKRADIGVAMGITGTDVSKEAADMVLQDDNFATIVAAIEEGRTIYDNLRKFIKFSLAGNIGKVSVMLLAPLLGKPLPLEPLQLLWLNLLTDGLLGLGLGLEPPEKDAMRRPPYSPQAGIFSQGVGLYVAWVGALIGLLALGVGYIYWRSNPGGPWQTMTFTTLAFSQMAQAMATRSRRESFFRLGLRSNLPGTAIALAVLLLQLAAIYLPFLQNLLYTQPLALQDIAISLVLSSLVFWAIEVEKVFIRKREVAC